MSKISNSSKRIVEMMEKLSLRQADVVNTTGITKSALSNYIHGTREPRQDQISKIADPYNVNPSWLMGYDVPMFVAEIEPNKNLDRKPTQKELMLLYYLSILNREGFEEAFKRIEELTELEKYKKEEK